MAKGELTTVLHHIRTLAGVHATRECTDQQLLEQFAKNRDEFAFAAIVRRHGPLVLGVCRRIVRDHHDADEAFQATFLVLARKAGSVRWRGSVGNWLYEVASRVSRKLRAVAARQRAHELSTATPATDRPASTPDPLVEASRRELFDVLDEEVGRLPNKYRAPVVLCYLQGKTHEEAASQLGWPSGSMSRHLARAHDLLRERLVRRGVVLSATLLTAAIEEKALAATVPTTLCDSTAKAALAFAQSSATATAVLSGEAAALAKGVLKAMLITKLKFVAMFLVAASAIAMGASGAVLRAQASKSSTAAENQAATAKAADSQTKNEDSDQQVSSESVVEQGHRELRQKLDQPIALEMGIDGNTPLRDALEFISDRYQLTILIDEQAFKSQRKEKEKNVGDEHVRLPKMNGIPAGTILSLLAAQVDGTYLVRPEYVEITTLKRSRPVDWVSSDRDLAPKVNATFDQRPLDRALRQLASSSGINVILDGRVTEKAAQTPITTTFIQAPVDTAVQLLADMGDLKSVAMDNMLYVTTKANAEALQSEQESRLKKHESKLSANPPTTSKSTDKEQKNK